MFLLHVAGILYSKLVLLYWEIKGKQIATDICHMFVTRSPVAPLPPANKSQHDCGWNPFADRRTNVNLCFRVRVVLCAGTHGSRRRVVDAQEVHSGRPSKVPYFI